MKFQTPILIIGFNRPEKLEKLLSVVSSVEPENLFVCIDGPRSNNTEDVQKNKQILNILDKHDLLIKNKNVRSKNLGCKKGVSEAISWFFESNEFGIILEDDCLPNPSFFNYCEVLLDKYQDNKKIMHISGHKKIIGKIDLTETYYFSNIANIWGWATWKDRWSLYDIEMSGLESNKKNILNKFENSNHGKYWYKLFKHIHDKNIDTWDAQWQYSVLINNGLCISPTINLIENVGFDMEATHTISKLKSLNTETDNIISVVHPATIEINNTLDSEEMNQRIPSIFEKILNILKR